MSKRAFVDTIASAPCLSSHSGPARRSSAERRRVSYSGYYECFPSIRDGFDSRYPLHRAQLGSADVAQLVEQCFRKAKVVGSNPTIGSRKKPPHAGGFLVLAFVVDCRHARKIVRDRGRGSGRRVVFVRPVRVCRRVQSGGCVPGLQGLHGRYAGWSGWLHGSARGSLAASDVRATLAPPRPLLRPPLLWEEGISNISPSRRGRKQEGVRGILSEGARDLVTVLFLFYT